MKNIIAFVVFTVLVLSANVYAADGSTNTAAAKHAAAEHQEMVNINTADAQTLTQLKGIGPKKAEAIVAWRKANGNFKTVEQLSEVKGIAAKTVEANRAIIRLQ